MKLFKWNDSYSVYLPEMDAEHKALFRMIANLQKEIMSGAPAGRVLTMLHETITHITGHFAHEEQRMTATRCPYYRWHKKQHETATRSALEFERRIRRGDGRAPLELLDFFSNWLRGHLALADRMMAAHLRACSRHSASLAS